jgi:hypothetical protein
LAEVGIVTEREFMEIAAHELGHVCTRLRDEERRKAPLGGLASG